MTTLQERIAELMAETKATHADLMRVTKLTSPAITFIINGPTKSLKTSTAAKLERAYGYSAAWLSDGTLPKKAREYDPPVNEGHWRRVAQMLAKELAGTPCNAEKFVAAVDVLSELIEENSSDEKVSGVARRHLRLVA